MISRGQASFFDALTFLLIVSSISAAIVLFSNSYGIQTQKALYNTIDLDYTNSLMNALLHAKYDTGEQSLGGHFPVKEFVIQAVKKELSFIDSNYKIDKNRLLLKKNSFGEKQLNKTLKKLMGPIFYQKGLIFVMTDIKNPDNFTYCLFHEANNSESSDKFDYCDSKDINSINDISNYISKKLNVFSATAVLTIPINRLDRTDTKTLTGNSGKQITIPTYILKNTVGEKKYLKMTLMLWDL